jgi:uncharacterized protein (TIGR02266 family)
MSQDTRKDPRAKVLSMTVRYKSATIDEFIENHSHDVSRGGIFIKTSSPFPPGTLLKFEIRIQDEQTVLGGVGRVVWKRDADQVTDDSPGGMGVKFIKIDDKSKGLIARLVDAQKGGPSAYDLGKPGDAGDDDAAEGMGTGNSQPPPAAAAGGAKQPRASTMLGLGSIGAAAKATGGKPAATGDAGGGGGFFPTTDPSSEMPPPEERTVMRQAAELLKQALAGTGSSLDEVGGKIELAKDTPKAEEKKAESVPPKAESVPPKAESVPPKAIEPLIAPKPDPVEAKVEAIAAKEEAEADAKVEDKVEDKPESKKLEAKKADDKPTPNAASATKKPAGEDGGRREAKTVDVRGTKAKDGEGKTKPRPAMAKPAMVAPPEPVEESSGSGRFLTILLVAAVIGGGIYLALNRGNKATQTPPAPAPTAQAAPTPPAVVPTPVPTPANEIVPATSAGAAPTAAPTTTPSAAPTTAPTAAAKDPAKTDAKPAAGTKATDKPAEKPAEKPKATPPPAPAPTPKPPAADEAYE